MTTTTASLDLTTGTWVIDPSHTRVGFSAKHAMIAKVRGQFSEFSGSLTLDGSAPEASKALVT
ncbi:MAG: YceI family protein, partial [Actinomycetes bacterium]